jgi:predicted RNA binding protein YcfA (HicA-like mRNA interferase family)
MEIFPIFVALNNKTMKYKEFHRFIRENGWVEKRQTGSHIFYVKPGHPRSIPVPMHSGEIPEKTRLGILKEMGLK